MHSYLKSVSFNSISLTVILFACFSIGLSGCGNNATIPTEYGKISGESGSTSLNGTSVFHDMFRERGFKVKRRKKISPRIKQYDTIVWFPDNRNCPGEEAVAAINDWMEDGYNRTLIYVGRGYESQIDYLNQVKDDAPIVKKEEMMRQMAEAHLARDREEHGYDFWYQKNLADSCEWFENKKIERAKATVIEGALAEDVQVSEAELEVSGILSPKDYSEEDYEYEVTTLLKVNEEDFAFQVSENYEDDGNRIIVVSNGSFLLNFPLVQPENRKLAGSLIDYVDPYSDVLFLESGPMGIEVSDSDITNHNSWAWIAEPPLRYIVPQFLLWGIVFCFVYFPIFGRPKRLVQRNTASFRSHINATAKLIGRSKLPNKAANRIQKYQDNVAGDANRKRNE